MLYDDNNNMVNILYNNNININMNNNNSDNNNDML